jgi:hypothetical protein
MEVFHTNEHRGNITIVFAQGNNQWLGDGYYFWQDYEFAIEWAKVKKYPVADIYSVELNIDFTKDEDIIDTVFNEEDYYKFVEKLEYFAKKYYEKFGQKPYLEDFNNFIQDNNFTLWKGIKAIRFQDTPSSNTKNYLRIMNLPYKKRIQIVLFDKEKIIKFVIIKNFKLK